MIETSDQHGRPYPEVPNFRPIAGTKLYRSSKLDPLDESGIDRLQAMGIMTVMDLRSPEGWEDATCGLNLSPMDVHYKAFSVAFSSWVRNVGSTIGIGNSNIRETNFTLKALKGRAPKDVPASTQKGRRLFLNVVDKEFALGLLRTVVPWYQVPWIVLLMLSFLMFRTRLFLSEFARIAMNKIGIIGQYTSIIKYCGEPIQATLKIISEPSNVPSVVCCAQGKDRTGVISALIMGVCGASREEIVREYAASEAHVAKMSETMKNYTASYFLNPEFGTAKPATMEALLDYIDKEYGSIVSYLETIGFTKEDQETLRCNVAASKL